jgi:hypothetical protein
MEKGRPRTPAPTMAVTLWKEEYHHFAFLSELTGSQSSICFSLFDDFPLSLALSEFPSTYLIEDNN